MAKLVLIRHGQSLWNLKNLFTGWVDVPLSEQGISEAQAAGKKLASMDFQAIYVSTLIRAQQTAMIALAYNKHGKVPIVQKDDAGEKEREWAKVYSEKTLKDSIPVYRAWELNERYYGELQGMDKKETADKYGEDQVHIWRRSYDVPPPKGESLKLTAERTIPYFKDVIQPELAKGKTILVSAHGNSLRSIVMFLENLSEEQVLKLEIATGDPILFEYSDGNFFRGKI